MSSCQRITVEQIVQSVHVCLFHSETPIQIHGFSQFLFETLLNDSLETSSSSSLLKMEAAILPGCCFSVCFQSKLHTEYQYVVFLCSSLQLRPFSSCQLQLVCCTCDKL